MVHLLLWSFCPHSVDNLWIRCHYRRFLLERFTLRISNVKMSDRYPASLAFSAMYKSYAAWYFCQSGHSDLQPTLRFEQSGLHGGSGFGLIFQALLWRKVRAALFAVFLCMREIAALVASVITARVIDQPATFIHAGDLFVIRSIKVFR
jgi:hypothetical protein